MVDALLLRAGALRSAATEQSDGTAQNTRMRPGRKLLVGIRGRTRLNSNGTAVKQTTTLLGICDTGPLLTWPIP
ncbi:hypothetical protein D3C87_1366420 [compost metagenome]